MVRAAAESIVGALSTRIRSKYEYQTFERWTNDPQAKLIYENFVSKLHEFSASFVEKYFEDRIVKLGKKHY
jgi:hypothetical protein